MRTVLSLILVTPALALAGAEHADMPYHGEGHMIVLPEALAWQDIASMAPGARMAVIEGDLSKEGPFTFRLKLPANYRVAPHVHPAYERVTVLKGTFHFAHGREFDPAATTPMTVGSFAVMPPGDPMFGYTDEETIIQLHGTGPWGIEYINPEDDPRRQANR